MPVLIAILLLLIAPLAMLLIRLLQPRFAYSWLIAAAAASGAWVILLAQQNQLPLQVTLVGWQPQEFFQASPALLLDQVSWPFALAIATLTLAALLSDLAQPRQPGSDAPPPPSTTTDWWAWAASLTLAGLGLLAALSANLITVLLTWSALDLVEIMIWLSQARSSKESEQVVVAFSGRLAGIVGILWTALVAKSTGLPLSFEDLTPQTGAYLVTAAGLRLGVLPGNVTQIQELARRRSLSSLLHLTPAAASLVLLGRAFFGADPLLAPYLLAVIGLAAIYGGLGWLNAADERQGQSSWVLGMAALALGSAVLGQPAAGLAWGLALLLPGGLLFLSAARHRWLLPLHIISLACLFALPFTPTWQGVRLYAPPTSPIMLLFLVGHALLLTGYLRHMLRLYPTLSSAERWLWFIFPLGMALPSAVYLWISWWSRSGTPNALGAQPLWVESWPGLVSLLIWALFSWIFIVGRSGLRAALHNAVQPPAAKPLSRQAAFLTRLQAALSLGWLYRLLWASYFFLRRGFSLVSRLLEGQGGILWALLLLTLLLTLLIQVGIPAFLSGGA